MNTTFNEAKKAYEKFTKDNKGFLWLDFGNDKTELLNFSDVQKENSAYTSVYLGIKNVNIDDIRGSVQKYMDFDSNFVPKNSVIETRWCNIYMAFMNGISLPPVELYKIKDNYFVYDGNHRISVAKYLNFKSIEAEVTEFIPSLETKENIIYREKFMFEKITGLENIIFTETDQYKRIIKEINDYKEYIENKESKKLDFLEAAKEWYDTIFVPCCKIMDENKMLENFPGRTYADLYAYFLDHKYFESEKMGRDIGYSFAIVDFINLMKSYNNENSNKKIEVSNDVKENLQILFEHDKKKYLDKEIIKKNDILREETGIEFNHNLFILFEIDEYIRQNNINDFRNGVISWYQEKFLKKIEEFEEKIKFLPENYSKKSDLLLKNKEKMFFSIQNYAFMYSKRKKYSVNYSEVIANYILEVYIPIVEILNKNNIADDNFFNVYCDIQDTYNYISEYKTNISISEAAEAYFKESGRKYLKTHDWFLFRFNDNPKNEILIDYVLGKFKEKVKNKDEFSKIIEKYGKPQKYGTLFKLEKAKDLYELEYPEYDWVVDKLKIDMEKITTSQEILRYFNTSNVLDVIRNKTKESNLIDFYADVVSYADYLGKKANDIDIIDIVMEYIGK